MFRKQIAIDLGTANTLVFVQSHGIVINEPSVVAIDTVKDKIIAIGSAAKKYIGKTPQHIRTVRPLRDGVIADFDATSAMITYFLQKSIEGWNRIKPDVIICVPPQITEVERRAVVDAAIEAGAKGVKLIAEPVAAAIGAGLPVLEPVGNMVVDIGGGTTDMAIITLGSMANARSLRLAGDAMTAAIQHYLHEVCHMLIGENMAEKIKITLGSVVPLPLPLTMEISGKDTTTGNPKTITITDVQVREALQPIAEKIVENVIGILETVAPELGVDIMQRGILLTGGGALLRGLDEAIHKATRMPVTVDPEPLTTVLRGAGLTLGEQVRYQDMLFAS